MIQKIKLKITGRYGHFDNATWPLPFETSEDQNLEWTLRYGRPSKEDMLAAAGYISAYRRLYYKTKKDRDEVYRNFKYLEKVYKKKNKL